ncbi:hypothetical protein [Haloarcula halophila]|uniref:hypothetical protein n=1 Tax=Haloarcula TaxID=2237 RepID=UPI0023E37D1B|nr:hypothetical protein [Halomicroarcula sp. DFY41]
MDRRKFLIGLGSLAAGGAAASGTGAFTAATVGRDGDIGVANDDMAYISLSPGGARGIGDKIGYENGDLYIDFSEDSGSGTGVNDQARFQLGAMDDDAQGDSVAFSSLYDGDTNPAAAGDGWPYDDGTDQSAFVIENQTDQALDIEVGLQETSEASGATVYLQGVATEIQGASSPDPSQVDSATSTETTALDLDDPTDGQTDPDQALSFNNANDPNEAVPSGESVYVSLQVDTTDSDTTGEFDLTSQFVVNANEAADPGQE